MGNYSGDLGLIFGALSDATRRGILTRLCRGTASVGDLKTPFPIALPNLLKHIRVLEDCGLITTEKQGRVRYCTLKTEALLTTEQWLVEQRMLMEQNLDQMEAYIKKLKLKEKGD